jgi:hypothetical protein
MIYPAGSSGTREGGVLDDPALDDRWTDIFRRDMLVHLGIMGSIVVATFQGYLKDHIPGFLPYALAELFFLAAFIVWFGTLVVRHLPVRGPGIVPGVVLTAIFVPVLYLLHPTSPLVLRIAGLRAWAEFPIACLMALSVIKSRGQARAYVGLILLLCAITAVYGIVQYRAGPQLALSSELARIRHGPTVFYKLASSRQSDFRAFSTFTFPSPFAGMMVFGILLAISVAITATRPSGQRVLAGLLIPLLFMGMTVSGTRAALIVLLVGLMLIGWYRGLTARQLALVPLLMIAFFGATLLTSGRIIARWRSALLNESILWKYVYAPVTIAVRALHNAPFGLGLGRSGVGVPYTIMRSYPQGFIVGSDGDIGRAAVEMGVFGLLLLALIMVTLIPYASAATRRLVHTASQDLGLGMGSLVIATGVLVLIGSPMSSVPHAVIWWFCLGALLKLRVIEATEAGSEQRAT